MICVTTRFRLRHFWDIIPMYLAYRRMRPGLARTPGLVRYAFLVESPRRFCTLSIWESEIAITRLSTSVPSHVAAVRHAKRSCRSIWSAYWRLDAVSKTASAWEGPDGWPGLVPDVAHPHLLTPLAKGGQR